MYRIPFLLLCVLCALQLGAQSSYRSGYLIDNAGNRRAVEILDRDWTHSPTAVRYRVPGQIEERQTIHDIREFGYTDGSLRYLRAPVALEASSWQLNSLSDDPAPTFREAEVFLEVLLDGEADLFRHKTGKREYFFYRMGEGDILPLVRRRYLHGERVIDQNLYRPALRNGLSCGADDDRLRDLGYTRRELLDYFAAYHACRGLDYTTYRAAQRRYVRLSLDIGQDIHRSSVAYSDAQAPPTDFPVQSNTRFGFELESAIPYLHQRYALFAGLYYQRYRTPVPDADKLPAFQLDMRLLHVPVGFRRYFALGDRSVAYASVLGQFQVPPDSHVILYTSQRDIKVQAFNTFALGVGAGVRLAGHIRVEARYLLPQDALRRVEPLKHRQQSLSLLAGYQF